MSINRWITVAPVSSISIATIVTIGLVITSILLATNSPWLGVEFDRDYTGKGIRVKHLHEHSPALGKLKAGDVIRAFETPAQGRVVVSPIDMLDDPDQLSSYAEYNLFFKHQQALWDVISAPSFTVVLSNNRHVEISAAPHPGPLVLPATFWWLLLFGGTSFLIGISVWSLRRRESFVQILAVSGVGFMLGSFSCAIYASRELALPSQLFFGLASLNHLGIMTFAYSTILFFSYYPLKLINGPIVKVFVLGVLALWLNETLQWLSTPVHAFYAHFIFAYSTLVFFTWLQWRKSRHAPLQRAMIKWLLATMLLSLGFTVAMFYVPIIITGKPIASTILTFGAVFVLYLSLIIGIVRYHQFDMHHWWLIAWQWMIFILVVLFIDALFVYFLHLSNTTSIGLTVGAASAYLMVRMWIWGTYSNQSGRALDHALPHLVDALIMQKHNITHNVQWQLLVTRVFKPLSVNALSSKHSVISIGQNGLALHIPSLDGISAMEVFCCNQGKRLFDDNDVYLAKRLLELMRHTQDIISAREQGVQEERHRIQRDLHDDVAARLLSLMHQTREPVISNVARNALRGLRDIIHLLGDESALLEDVMTDIEAESREQLSGLGVKFEWLSTVTWPDLTLSTQQHINLRRITREAIANTLKHAQPQSIQVEVKLDGNVLNLRIRNDGNVTPPANWIAGRGLNNIKSRVTEMGGSHEWGIELEGDSKQYCYLDVKVPLPLNE